MRSFLSKWGAIAAVVALVAVQAAAVNYLGRNNYLPEGSDHWTEDWLIHYFSKRLDKPHKDVALVLVDAESLEKAGLPARIPVDRGWMARLVTEVAKLGPAAIGVDFYFSSPIDAKDEQLIAAIRGAPAPLVLAAVDDSFLRTEGQRVFQRDFLKRVNRPAGHIYFKRSKEIFTLGDRATRGVDHGPSADGYASLTSTLASLPAVAARFGAKEIPEGTQRIDWLRGPTGGSDAIFHVSAHEVLSPAAGAEPPQLKDKIVLIGPNFVGLDKLSVPFALGSDQTLFPGVFVHAQALAQILDGRFFLNWTSWQQFLLLFAIGILGAAVGWISSLDIVIGIGGSLFLIALSAPMFVVHAPLPTALAILSWAFSISIAQRVKSWRDSRASAAETVSGRSA
jgi:adenylate cyclase